MGTIITTQNVNRIFQNGGETVHALRDVNIEIVEGTLTVLRGRSGSGKTTLLNLLGALDYPDQGKVLLYDQDITKLSESARAEIRRLQMGFVFQSVALVSLMSALENVEFALRIAQQEQLHRTQRAEECLSFVGLQKRVQHRPHELSGGEQQRVAIARAIAHRPKILFADEPTGELDTHMGLQVVHLFKELARQEGYTVVMTTHDPNMMELADYVYTLEDGTIIERVDNLSKSGVKV